MRLFYIALFAVLEYITLDQTCSDFNCKLCLIDDSTEVWPICPNPTWDDTKTCVGSCSGTLCD
jgi:hypothetical protein